ncbi:MAG: hypothetical protein M3P45_10365 [Acidobacteriota bacterium]|nr:hypothetical protein [Acidobacteriota bacterium]
MSFVERRRFLWILFFVRIALAAVVANATTLAPLSFDSLAQRSSAVARLRCLSAQSAWDGGEIWTTTQFEVLEIYKGALGGIITVRMLGGRARTFYSRVDGVPSFRTGEEVYLFLWGKPSEPYRVLGWSQGTFRIVHDAQSGADKVTQESATTGFDQYTRQFRGEGIRGMGLPAFQEKLRQALERHQPADR